MYILKIVKTKVMKWLTISFICSLVNCKNYCLCCNYLISHNMNSVHKYGMHFRTKFIAFKLRLLSIQK